MENSSGQRDFEQNFLSNSAIGGVLIERSDTTSGKERLQRYSQSCHQIGKVLHFKGGQRKQRESLAGPKREKRENRPGN